MEISLDKLEAGSVLSQPVINNYGQMLLPAGVEVSMRQIIMLKTWNIKTIQVKGEDEELIDTDFGDDIVKRASRRIKNRLNWIPENEWEQELYTLGLKRACEIIGKSK